MADNDFNSDGFPKDFSPRDFSETPHHRADSFETEAADLNKSAEADASGADCSGNKNDSESQTTNSPFGGSFGSDKRVNSQNPKYGSAFASSEAGQLGGSNAEYNGSTASYDPRFGGAQYSDGQPQAAPRPEVAPQEPQQGFGQFAQPTFPQGAGSMQGFGNNGQGFGGKYIEKHGGKFFPSLLDFKFKRFITVKHAPVIFGTFVALGVVFWILALLAGLDELEGVNALGYSTYESAEEEVFVKFLFIEFNTFMLFAYIIFVRVALEWAISAVKTSDSIGRLQGKRQE